MYENSAAATFGRAAIVVLMLFSYPLQAHPCRGSLDKIFAWRPGRAQIALPSRDKSALLQMSDPRFAALTALILTASYGVAMTVASLDRVLAFVGSTGSTAISFILPGIFYHRMTRPGGLLPRAPEDSVKDDDDDSAVSVHLDDDAADSSSSHSSEGESGKRRARRKAWRRGAAVVLVGYGFVIMGVCLSINIVVGRGGH
jgi:hypothetical protein